MTTAPDREAPKRNPTRCYWTLLSAELRFLYVDPVLHDHLDSQADVIIGRKLLEFVHPDEHASAQQDLGKVLESRTLHGSVTRVRYSRIGSVRARLGFTGVYDNFTDEDKVSFDEHYMACDLVINWAAEGLVLCFIHAVVDMTPQDNDEHNLTPWSNWCGTPHMTVEHGTELYRALFHVAPHIPQGAPPPTRVFQILQNTTDRPILFSFPGEGYVPEDYGRLASDVQIGGANGSDAKTSCTRRYKAQQLFDGTDGAVRDVESIFIPHGQIIFACHKATPHRSRGHQNSYPLYPTPAQFYDTPGHTHTSYYPPVPVPSQADPYPGTGGNVYSHFTHPGHPPSHPQAQSHQHQSSLPGSSPSSPNATRGAGTQSPYQHQQTQTEWPVSHTSHPPYIEHHSPNQRYPLLDEVPPPRQRAGRLSPEMSASPGGSTREIYPIGGRAGGNPPIGVSRCAACKSTSSPEWRKGPSGRKDLCNACGLRYSRARAKKEGLVSQRRRKDTGKAQASSPAQAPSSPSKKRGYASNGHTEYPLDEQLRMGPGSGEGSTPSPSPPHDYPPTHSQQHTPSSSGLYSYPGPIDPRHQNMYVGQSHSYSTQQQQQQHGDGFLATTPSPAPGTSSAVTPASSYERAGMPANLPPLENQNTNVHS